MRHSILETITELGFAIAALSFAVSFAYFTYALIFGKILIKACS